jgi:hypothetical protein
VRTNSCDNNNTNEVMSYTIKGLIFILIIKYIVAYYTNIYNNNMMTSIMRNICKYNNRITNNRYAVNSLVLNSYIHDYTENQKKFLFGDNVIKFRDFERPPKV